MYAMERKYRYLFTLCLIIGFQIHVPVTMHPAIPDLHSSLVPDEDERGINSETTSDGFNSASNDLGGIDGYTSGHVVEYTMQRQIMNEQGQSSGQIASLAGEHNPGNNGANQAGPASHDGFNIATDLSGLKGSFDLKQPKSVQSDFNRLSSDLVGVRLKQIEARLSNLSSDISVKRKLAPRHQKQQTLSGTIKEGGLKKTDQVKADQNNNLELKGINGSQSNINKYVNEIQWSKVLEHMCPSSFSERDYFDWKRKIDANDVIKMEEGCGSMQNRLVTFNDSTKACVRYRMNTELMQGDIYSFYLGKLLNLQYTPPSALVVPINSKQWRQVKPDAEKALWSEHKPAIVTQYMPDLGHVYMPLELRNDKRQLRPENYWFENRPTAELCEFVQWTDLVVFDYISGNLDRVVNNLFNLKWNSKMLEKPIHNLMKIKTSGLFLYLDNESGLFHGYRLLDSYAGYHKKLLDTVCVFRKSTMDAIERLHKGGNAGEELQNLYQATEQHHGSLPRMQKKTMQTLQDRISDVYKHIQLCKNEFSGVYLDR